MEEEDNTLRRILSEIEESGISVSTLLVIQSCINSDSAVFLWDQLSSRRLPVSDLITPISSSMDSASSSLSLLASNVYLSLLLSPNAPLFSLFTPISFLSLLRSIRRSLKFRKEAASSRQNGGDRFDANLFFGVLEKLGCALALLHLVRFPDLFKSLVQVVAEIPVLGFDLCGNNTANRNKLFGFCAGIMKEVLRPEHGEQEMTAAEVLKSLTPLILSAKSQARTFALMFVRDEMIGLSKESSSVRKAVVNLPRYLAQKAPEKSAAEPILDVVKAMEFEDQVGFVDYVVKMAKGKSQLRYLAVDLIPKLLVSIQVVSGSELESEGVEDSWKSRCLVALVERCSDSVAGIRARALSSLAQLVRDASDDDRDSMLLKKALGFKDGQEGRVYNFLKKKCMDEKAAVRKAALFLITKLIALVGSSLDPEILKVMGITCSDPLVSIRKAAISALSEAFRIFSDRNVAIEWLHSVPRLINDSESSIQEECESLFMELVIDKVSRAGFAASTDSLVVQNSKSSPRSFQQELAALYPGVLDLLSEMCNGEVTPWVRKICSSLGKKGKLRPKIATALQNIIKTSEHLWLSQSMAIDNWTAPPGTWLLLSEVSSFLPKAVDWEFLYHHWKLLDKDVTTDELKSHAMEDIMHQSVDGMETNSAVWACDRVLLLQTISNVSVELSPEPAAQFAHDLLKRIEGFNMHSTEVNAHVKALKTLCKQKAMNPQEAEALVTKSVEQLFCKASHIVDMYLSSEEPTVSKENDLFTPPRSITIKGKRKATLSKLALQASTAVYTIGSLVIICPTLDLKTIIPVLHSMITSGTHEPRSNQLPGSRISVKEKAPGLYIQAWLTMGKICLADGKLAKRYIPLFVQELEKSDCAALRNNIIVIMADFCVRYTGLVDCYIAKITKCLRDSCELVRRQTFILLSRLLQTDYVKWRGVLFLRFLLSLDDESEKIRQLADFLFGNILKAKAPLLAYNSFVEAVFVLNDCQAYVTSNKSQNSRVERRLFSIRGNDENSRSRRMHIYVSLLKQMAPEHLLATFAKICAEILAAASDGILSIDEASGQSVLQDAFRVLTCKEIRLPASRAATSDAADMDEEVSGGAASAAAARGRVITQAVKKGLIQNTIPIFIELKRLLENKNSPLIGSLMECLRVLLKDYKNEIEDILVADKQLQKELIYDMQKYETVKAKSTATEAIATMHRSQEYHTPIAPDATIEKSKLSKKLHSDSKVASAMADVAAATVAKSVLKEVNKGAATPPLSLLNIPRLRTADRAGLSRGQKSVDVIESLRRRQTFDFNEEN